MDKKSALAQVYAQLEAAAPSLPLAQTTADIVPGEGSPNAQLMFIGEAPGYHESVERRPFVGRSGQLFRQTLEKEVGINPKQVYISNIVKVRPPENRDPTPQEILAFKPYLDQEIAVIEPLIIVTLGRFSMAKFLPDVRISQVHGRLHSVVWEDKRLFVLPMYHPAAALRGTRMKHSFIEDFKKIPKIIEWAEQKRSEFELTDTVKSTLL